MSKLFRGKKVVKKHPGDLLLYLLSVARFRSVHHFAIPWGHGRGFKNGSEATQLTLSLMTDLLS